ncbi:MAG: hypothetical protein HYS24_10255 [Ignavibacteriales bacterium]|nr:hypothetical protein [Ignavibacteriales bacterium]MBK7980970.1 hypothetical protein [Ignavibacteriota bacterium]
MFSIKWLNSFTMLSMLFFVTNCCTSKNETKEEPSSNLKENQMISLAPGSAEIKCNVKEILENGNKSFCTLKVISVENYGPSTRPISAETEIQIEIKDVFKERLENAEENDEELLITIASMPAGMGTENSLNWKIVKINE